MNQSSRTPTTQLSNTYPSSDPAGLPSSIDDSRRSSSDEHARVPSPTFEEDDNDSRSPNPLLFNGGSSKSSASDSDDESTSKALPASKIYPPFPRHQSSSVPQNSFPFLSSLPKDLLRIGSMPTSVNPSSQPVPVTAADESEESEASSSEEDVPAGLKGRFAGGSAKKKERTGGVMNGW